MMTTKEKMIHLDRHSVDFSGWHKDLYRYNTTLVQSLKRHIEYCVDCKAIAENNTAIY